MNPSHSPDFSDYIGIPFKSKGRSKSGCDCWGLVKIVLDEQFGIETPDYEGYEHTTDCHNMAHQMEDGLKEWVPVEQGEEQPGDMIVLRLLGLPIHVGVVIAPGQMIHTRAETNAVTERYTRPQWAKRILGFYRYHPRPHSA